MTSTQNAIVNLIACYLKGYERVNTNFEELDLEGMYMIAKNHDIIPLLFAALKKYYFNEIHGQPIYMEMKEKSMMKALIQVKHIESVKKVVKDFYSENIPVIVLKGLVLRSLYPNPESRTMTDADILVKKSDIANAKSILEKHGYQYNGIESMKDYHMCHSNNLPIELHWDIMNDQKKINGLDCSVDRIWEKAVPIRLGDAWALSLSPNDTLIHLCIHMAEHIYRAGIGLRQFLDIYLYIDKFSKSICWDSLIPQLELLSLKRFFYTILSIGNRYFFIEIPEVLKNKIRTSGELCEEVLDDVFNGGTFGGIKTEQRVSNRFLVYIIRNKFNEVSKFRTMLNFLFPSHNIMKREFSYVGKYPILLPFSWIHRFFNNVFRKERNRIISTILNSDKNSNSLELFKRRNRMLESLKED